MVDGQAPPRRSLVDRVAGRIRLPRALARRPSPPQSPPPPAVVDLREAERTVDLREPHVDAAVGARAVSARITQGVAQGGRAFAETSAPTAAPLDHCEDVDDGYGTATTSGLLSGQARELFLPSLEDDRRARRRLLLALLVVVAVAVAVVAVVALRPGGFLRADPRPSSGRASPAVATTAGPPLVPGLRLTATFQPDGSVRVDERLTSATALDSVEVAVTPRPVPGRRGDAAGSATELVVTADGAPVTSPDVVDRQVRRIVLPRRPHVVQLSYRLDGVTLRTRPGPPRRALAVVGPITRATSSTPVSLTLTDPDGGIHDVTCPALGDAATRCAEDAGGRWRTLLPADYVLVQLDLPR